MNKKFLSAILFGALMVTSTGTFVSCKDYDDDIENLQGQISANASAIAELKALIGDGNYVTSVTVSGQNLVVNTKNGSTTVALPECEDEVGSLAEVKDNELYIDGKATGIKVAEAEKEFQVPVKIVEGEWAVLQEDDTYLSTNIPASGVTAVKNDKGQWVLSVYNADGEKESIVLPTAASLISEAEIQGFLYPTAWMEYVYNQWGKTTGSPIAFDAYKNRIAYDFSIVGENNNGALTDAQKAWNKESMTKKLTVGQALSTISSSNSAFLIRIAPATVDASELEFSFVNSQMKGIDVELGAPVAYNGLLAESGRAAHENGLWAIPVSAKEGVVYEDSEDYMSQFQVFDDYQNAPYIKFALKEKEGFVSSFDMTFERFEEELTSEVYDVWATLNKEAIVDFENERYVYDAHMHFSEADVIRWGIQYSGNGVNFTVTKLNDELTIPAIYPTVDYVTLDGKVHSEEIVVRINKDVNTTVYDSNNIKLKADNSKNNFTISLDKMFNALGHDESVLWKNDIVWADVKYYRVKEGNESVDQRVQNEEITTTFLKSNGAAIASVKEGLFKNDALGATASVKVNVNYEAALDRTKQYYALISFYRVSDGAAVNTIKVPFTISIPTLVELLNKEQVVFGGTTDGTAVLNEYDYALDPAAVQYSLKYAFNGLADSFAAATMEFIVDPYQTIKIDGADVAMASLVNMVRGNQATAIVELNGATGEKHAYNKPINIQVKDGAKYLGVYAYTKEERAEAAFTLKLVSPIEQGTLTAKNGENAIIEVIATEDGKAKVTESDLVAKTYAGIAYKVFKDATFVDGVATAWSSPYIKENPVFESTNTNVFTVGDVKAATKDGDGNVTGGYVVINPMNVAYTDAVPVKVTVTDVWGYKKQVEISVKVLPHTAE